MLLILNKIHVKNCTHVHVYLVNIQNTLRCNFKHNDIDYLSSRIFKLHAYEKRRKTFCNRGTIATFAAWLLWMN